MSHFQIVLFTFLLIALLLASAFFSCAETGLMAVNRYRLRHKARMKKRYAMHILHLLKRPDRVLGTILIGNTCANIFASSLVTLLAAPLWGDKGALFAAVLLTLVILIFAEIAPKTIAAIYPELVARWVVYPIRFFLKLFYPLVWLSNGIVNILLRFLHIKVTDHAIEPLSKDELRSIVYETAGKMSRQYQNMLLGILDLTKLAVEDVMVPRHDIIGINIEQPMEVILSQISQLNLDWVVIYRENLNQVIGVLYLRDVFRLTLVHTKIEEHLFNQLLREPYFVPEGTPLSIQLTRFQQTQQRIAFVVDEYGEIRGLLTLDHILEEIVGNFTSSISAVGKRMQVQADGSYLAEGAMTVREFNRMSQWELPLRGPRTLNGLVTEYLEALPRAGTCLLVNDHPMEIIQVKENRVKVVRVFPKKVANV